MGPVSYESAHGIAVITVDSPPVNALSQPVREGIIDAIAELNADVPARAAVLRCAGRTFIAGADIAEFDAPLKAPSFADVIEALEGARTFVVAAIHGAALGGGLETAFGCDYRCASESARVGFPEVNLGLIPGAGGTQRLPRLVGVERALQMILSGRPIAAGEARAMGVIDEIIEGDLLEGALAFAERLVAQGGPRRRIRELDVAPVDNLDALVAGQRARIARSARGFQAPQRAIAAIEAAVRLPVDEGLEREWELFEQSRTGVQSKAQRHLFFAQREVSKIPDIPRDTRKRNVERIAVIGAGTMGSAIAMACANGGFPVSLIESSEDNLQRGLEYIRKTYEAQVGKGRMSAAESDERVSLIGHGTVYEAASDADLVIEAVFEDLAVKKEVFSALDRVCKHGAILATNTSTLDVDAIAASTARPADVIGLHFFAPANIMRLLEIVRGRETGKDVIATAFQVAKRLRKVGVLVGVCFGFVGNRMLLPYAREAQQLVLEGVAPNRIDAIAYDWGMAMGPLAVLDLSGIDIFYHIVAAWADRPDDPSYGWLVNELFALGRLGQKTGRGVYRYDGRKPIPDDEIMAFAAAAAERYGVQRRDVSDAEILQRLFYPMINEGAALLDEGIAIRPGDIDVIWTNGFGFPAYRGGPMMCADQLGVAAVRDRLAEYADRLGDRYAPSPLLERLAREGATFAAWSR